MSAQLQTYPRVAWLRYYVQIPFQFTMAADAQRNGHILDFPYEIRHRYAMFTTTTVDYPDVPAARAALEPVLEAWYVSALFSMGHGAIKFSFVDAGVQQAADSPVPGVPAIPNPPTIQLGFNAYPEPWGVRLNDLVRDLTDHFAGYFSDASSLLMRLYAMITRVAAEYGSLTAASQALNISYERLRYAKQLSTVRGKGRNARKFEGGLLRKQLTQEEQAWGFETMSQILYRSLLVANGLPPGDPLTGRP
jgi:hypothetical protein